MSFQGYFPKFTMSPGKTDERRGDGFGMICNGQSMMVDSFQGGEPTNKLLNWFLDNGVTTIDIALLTHWHWDHYNGFLKMLETGKIKITLVYAIDPLTYKHGVDSSANGKAVKEDMDNAYKVVRKLQSHGTLVRWIDHGGIIKVGDVTWDIYRKQPIKFNEYDNGHAYAFINDGSLVLYSPELKGMLPGDGPNQQKEAIAYFKKKYGSGNVKILRWTDITHHGNSFSRSNAEAAVDAGCKIAFESCIEKNGPGTTDWTAYGARRLKQQGVTVLMQNEDIHFSADNKKMTIKQGSETYTVDVPYMSTAIVSGWNKDSKGWFYINTNGKRVLGWQSLLWEREKHWFYFNNDGYALLGWQYLIDRQGKAKYWFFFDKNNGYMKTEWHYVTWSGGDDMFYFDPNSGAMLTGWQYLLKRGEKCWFYFDTKNGNMLTGWITYKGKKCYLEPDDNKNQGRAYQNETAVIGGKTYQFDNDRYATEIKSESIVIDKSKKFIDASEFNDIDWALAKNELKGVMLRCGLRGSLKSNEKYYKKIRKDFKFDEHRKSLEVLKIPYSVYYFPTDCTDAEATESAKWLYELVKDLGISFPIALDVENVKGSDGEQGRANNLNKKDRTRFLKIILDYLESKGYNIGIYASASWFGTKIDMAQLSENANKCTWVADWDAPVDYKGKYWLWQYGKTTIKGCSKQVDANSVIYNMPAKMANAVSAPIVKEPETHANPVDVLINIAKAEVGYHEGPNNQNKYGDELHKIQPSNMDKNAAWCDAFVDWCILQMCRVFGYDDVMARKVLCGDFDDYTYFSINHYKKAKRWTTKPGVGYQIFFGGAGHTGIVYKVDASKVYTIEGNKGDEVRYCSYSINDSSILGYGMPRYDLVGDTIVNEVPNADNILRKGCTGKKVKFLQLCLGNLTVDGSFGMKTLNRVILFQENYKLYPDGEVGPETWAAIVRILPMIQKGDQGRYVEALQTILGGLTVDGSFGDKTLTAVKKFQNENGLEVDGIVGPKTWAMIVAKLVM